MPTRKFCSGDCRFAARQKVPCSSCGGPSGKVASDGRGPSEVYCLPCRRAFKAPVKRIRNKRARGLTDEWTCAGCGVACSRPATKGQRRKWCDLCAGVQQNRYIRIPHSARLSIYARDAWTCWICEGPVDGSLIGSRDQWRPSLDHVIPRSRGGSDDVTNLSLAHLWCNVARNDERAHTVEDFRV